MLDDQKLRTLLCELETVRVERTRSLDKIDKFSEAVCAFANDLENSGLPGYLIIGANDDGSLSGLIVKEELLQRLSAIRSDGHVLPQPVLYVAKYTLDGAELAVIEVMPSDMPPVRYKGRAYIRVGPRRGIANEQERMLTERRMLLARSFDTRACRESSVEDLAFGVFEVYRRAAISAETIAENHRPIEAQLASLRLFDTTHQCLSYAGVLLFGKSARFFMPGAYVQFLHFPGSAITDVPLDQAEISGDIVSVVRELEIRVRTLIKTQMQVAAGFKEVLIPDYPEFAIRELVMNAVMHRNYDSNTPIRLYAFSDRIEIQSPGGLYGEATTSNFPHQSAYRNPVIAEAMKALGFVNRFGYGVQRAQKLLLDNGNPALEFSFEPNSVRVKVLKAQHVKALPQ
jgi:ATP-dependent DNA helicase RecG